MSKAVYNWFQKHRKTLPKPETRVRRSGKAAMFVRQKTIDIFNAKQDIVMEGCAASGNRHALSRFPLKNSTFRLPVQTCGGGGV